MGIQVPSPRHSPPRHSPATAGDPSRPTVSINRWGTLYPELAQAEDGALGVGWRSGGSLQMTLVSQEENSYLSYSLNSRLAQEKFSTQPSSETTGKENSSSHPTTPNPTQPKQSQVADIPKSPGNLLPGRGVYKERSRTPAHLKQTHSFPEVPTPTPTNRQMDFPLYSAWHRQ